MNFNKKGAIIGGIIGLGITALAFYPIVPNMRDTIFELLVDISFPLKWLNLGEITLFIIPVYIIILFALIGAVIIKDK